MNILIDIGHPAHVHLFKHFAREMINRGHEIMFTCRDKEFEIYLLEYYGFKYKSFGKKFKSTTGKLFGMIKFDIKEFFTGLKFKPDVLLSHGSIYAAHAAFFLRRPHISLEDTGNMEQVRLYLPFTKKVLISNDFHLNFKKKEVRYNGIHELFYLHPDIFVPDNGIFKYLDIEEGSPYIVLRLIAWNASHDDNYNSSKDFESVQKIIDKGEEQGYKVFISSEKKLPSSLIHYELKIPPEMLHNALYFSSLYIGQGGTTATEASLLGTYSIIINPQAKSIGIHQALKKKYNIQDYFDDFESSFPKIVSLLNNKKLKSETKENLYRFMENKINPTLFLVDYISNKKWKE
jgi:predicted glycosyltransferase